MRHEIYLRQRYRAFLGYAGGVSAIIGLLYFVPLLVIPFYPEEIVYAGGFLLVGFPLILIGTLAWRWLTPRQPLSLTIQEGSVVVILAWIGAVLTGSLPFMSVNELSFSQALFESASGWTTTGLSVVDVTGSPRIILLFRSMLQLAGGAGFAIIALSAVSGSFSAGLVSAEGRTDQLAPHVRRSANIVLTIYSGYVLVGCLALRLAGMGWFDAINHAFTALSTGGFSTRPESIGYWDNPAIEAVTLVLMILGTINFFVAYTFLSGKIRVGLRSGELRLLFVVLVGSAVIAFAFVTGALYTSAEKSIRVAIFETTSALTTTGFSTVSYQTWPDFGWTVLITLMLIGGGTGSTAGGIKQLRIYILYKAIIWEVRSAFMPQHMVNEPAIWHGERRELLSDRQVRRVALFTGIYLAVFLIGSTLMMLYGYSMRDSLFEFASTVGTVGLSVGVTSPNMPVPLLWFQSLGMILGRLEFFTVIIGLIKLFKDVTCLIKFRKS